MNKTQKRAKVRRSLERKLRTKEPMRIARFSMFTPEEQQMISEVMEAPFRKKESEGGINMLTEREQEIEHRYKNALFVADNDIAYLLSTIQQLREERDKYRQEAMQERELSESIVFEREELIIENERLKSGGTP